MLGMLSVVSASYLCLPGKLAAFLHGSGPPFVDVGRQIHQMNSALGFLTGLDPHDRQAEIPSEGLAQEFVDREVAEEITTDLIDGHNGFAAVLSH
jgi:hypothetical protein